jgi:hypothetical protein
VTGHPCPGCELGGHIQHPLAVREQPLRHRAPNPVRAWWVLRDPAGLLFCLIPERPGTLNDSNAQRWD